MNLLEGARRMQVVGRVITFTGLGLVVLGLLIAITLATISGAVAHAVAVEPVAGFFVAVLGFWPLLFGGLLWIAGWILEGFVKPRVEAGLSRTEAHTSVSRR